ncbi:MAG: Fic family protein [Candidatus Saganbacteria bacterium]|nr:Fic family protein [Candidatus Saganbacteria bacterium]
MKKNAWIIRQEEELMAFSEIIGGVLKEEINAIKKHPLEKILEMAVARKKYDVYHSTTIEGYSITPEEVEAVILGKSLKDEGFEKLRNKMAILGHAQAFDYVLKCIKKDFKRPKITDEFIADIYFQLFKPSVDAKIIDRFDLLGYRRIKVYLRGSRYVPPSFEKVPDLMDNFILSLNKMGDSLVKAILSHYYFVTIHPYQDGNGRCGRLLMNYFLAASGYLWITITADEREAYFRALQAGQLDGNILPFAKLIISLLRK